MAMRREPAVVAARLAVAKVRAIIIKKKDALKITPSYTQMIILPLIEAVAGLIALRPKYN
jgi:hypothetical protein